MIVCLRSEEAALDEQISDLVDIGSWSGLFSCRVRWSGAGGGVHLGINAGAADTDSAGRIEAGEQRTFSGGAHGPGCGAPGQGASAGSPAAQGELPEPVHLYAAG